jgi:hypothetical protein
LVGVLGATADQHVPPRHPHMLVLGLELEGDEPVGFRKCIDLASGNRLPLNAHHAHLHQGWAGVAVFETLDTSSYLVRRTPRSRTAKH